MRVSEIIPAYIAEYVPNELNEGILYISFKYKTAIHLCACGCNNKTVTPLGVNEWTLTENDNKVSLRPSIGNFKGENPYHAHYYITDNNIQWL